jgi:hypothetical protein
VFKTGDFGTDSLMVSGPQPDSAVSRSAMVAGLLIAMGIYETLQPAEEPESKKRHFPLR